MSHAIDQEGEQGLPTDGYRIDMAVAFFGTGALEVPPGPVLSPEVLALLEAQNVNLVHSGGTPPALGAAEAVEAAQATLRLLR